jgi:hypothetical protein
MQNSLKPGQKALIVHGRIPELTGKTCTVNQRFSAISYDYAPSMGTFSAWDVTFDGEAVVDDNGRLCKGGKIPEIYLIPISDDKNTECEYSLKTNVATHHLNGALPCKSLCLTQI